MKEYTSTVKIPRDRIVDLFISACEGGSNYWCKELTPKGKGDYYEAMLKGFDLIEQEGGKKHKVTADMIEKAVHRFAIKEPRHFTNFIEENEDAETADVFLQLCVFGKTIYG